MIRVTRFKILKFRFVGVEFGHTDDVLGLTCVALFFVSDGFGIGFDHTVVYFAVERDLVAVAVLVVASLSASFAIRVKFIAWNPRKEL